MIKKKIEYGWESFRDHTATAFSSSLNDQALADVTLVADGSVSLFAHKFVLSSASPVLKQFFTSNPNIHSPCLFMFGLSSDVLTAIMEFIYRGETVVTFENLDAFMTASRNLQLSWNKEPEELTYDRENIINYYNETPTEVKYENNIHRGNQTVLNKNIPAEKDTKPIIFDAKTETIHKKERLGNKWQGSHIDQMNLTQTPALSEETTDIKIKRVVQEKKSSEVFKCELCSKTFEYKTTLRNHTLIKHS